MKIKNLLLTSAILALSLSSCSNDDDNGYIDNGKGVTFKATLEATVTPEQKAADTAWDTNDAIGVFMKQGAGLGTIVGGGINKKFITATGDGVFSPANPNASDPNNDILQFPSDGSSVDFIAYYPHVVTSSLTGNVYKVNVGSQASQEAIDLLYSDNATGKNNSSPTVDLNFKHQLSKVVFTVNAGNGITSLNGLVVTISGTETKADYALADGTLSNKSAIADIVTKTTVEANPLQAISEAIILPADGIAGRTVTFSVAGETKTWDIPNDTKFEKGKKNRYVVELKKGGGTSVYPIGSIEDWGVGSSENIVIDFDGSGGSGTSANPYSVAEAQTKVGETAVWVTGYIVGSTSKTKAFGSSSDNILLAPTAGETDEDKCIPVDIFGSAVQANLDIVANSELIGREIKVQGDIINTIFGGTVSLTNIIAQVGGKETGGGTPVEFFKETFGYSATVPTSKKINDYTEYDMLVKGVTYSDAYATTDNKWGDLRTTNGLLSTYNMHVWFPATTNTTDKESSLLIQNIEGGYRNITLSYDVAANLNTGQSIDGNVLIVKCNGQAITIPSTPLTTTNIFTNISVSIPDNTTTLEFYSPTANDKGIRLDNVTLTGEK